MNTREAIGLAYDAARALAIAFAGVVVVPLLVGFFSGIPVHYVLGLVGSALVLQTVAAGVGIGLGMPPLSIVLIMISFAVAVICALFALCDALADKSARLAAFIAKMDELTKRSRLFKKYGVLMLVPFIWIPGVGLYGCALIAWLFNWRGPGTIGLMLTGWLAAVVIVMLATVNLITLVA
jgi:uncharacterized membrane protein